MKRVKYYRFQEKYGMVKIWSRWYEAENIAQAYHTMMSDRGCDDESWQSVKSYYNYEVKR